MIFFNFLQKKYTSERHEQYAQTACLYVKQSRATTRYHVSHLNPEMNQIPAAQLFQDFSCNRVGWSLSDYHGNRLGSVVKEIWTWLYKYYAVNVNIAHCQGTNVILYKDKVSSRCSCNPIYWFCIISPQSHNIMTFWHFSYIEKTFNEHNVRNNSSQTEEWSR